MASQAIARNLKNHFFYRIRYMNWTDLISKIIFRVDKSSEQIVDGVIVQPELDTVKHDEQNEVSNEQSAHNEPEPREPVYYPITIPVYQPTYLLDSDSGGDIVLFVHWLQSNRYKAIKPYVSDCGIWREHLSGHIDSSELLRVISGFNLTRAKRLMYTLKIYGQYRYDYGDPRISIILAVDERKLRLPTPKRDKFSVIGLSPGAIEMLNDKAKAFCVEGDRCGIWIGLLLRGIPSSSIERVEILPNSSIRFKQWTAIREQRLPQWLFLSMTERISESLWRRNRVTVKRRVTKYEHPTVLYRNSASALKVLGE